MNIENELKELTCTIANPGLNEDGSYSRLPFSEEYLLSAQITADILEKEDLDVHIDTVGNVIGTLKGTNPERGKIMIGSHLDSVKEGGLYDGALGVASAIMCIKLLKENNIKLKHDLLISGLQAEEGSPLGGTFGSRSMMGLISIDEEYEKVLRSYGITKDDIEKAIIDTGDIKGYMELHIEQGKILETGNISIGIVTGIVGISRYMITIKGECNHAGTTPMRMRKDALICAAKVLTFIDDQAKGRKDNLVATVARMEILPSAIAVIPGEVQMLLEVRGMEQASIDAFMEKVKGFCDQLEGFDIDIRIIIEKPSVYCDTDFGDAIREACDIEDLTYTAIQSGAGHDGNAFGSKMPIGMIFVPSVNGLSHCKEEYTKWEDAEKGVRALYRTLLLLDEKIF